MTAWNLEPGTWNQSMCSACGVAPPKPEPLFDEEPPSQQTATTPPQTAAKFAALKHPDCRFYLFGTMLSMMADNVEHVITYWMLFQKFHSPALAGFAVISHWAPSLFLSVYFGGLADRKDCRKVIQTAQVMYMAVSAAWGVLFLTDSLQVWHACVLL